MFLSQTAQPRLIVKTAAQAFRCMQLFREAMLIKEEYYRAEVEALRGQMRR
jgi:hypothetical protein